MGLGFLCGVLLPLSPPQAYVLYPEGVFLIRGEFKIRLCTGVQPKRHILKAIKIRLLRGGSNGSVQPLCRTLSDKRSFKFLIKLINSNAEEIKWNILCFKLTSEYVL